MVKVSRYISTKSALAAHHRGDHVYEPVKGCSACRGNDTTCFTCLALYCLGCKKNHCAAHCRGRRPNAIRVVHKRYDAIHG